MFKVGDQFSSLEELETKLQEYEDLTGLNYWTRECQTLEPQDNKSDADENLPYYSISSICNFKNTPNNAEEQNECPAGMQAKLSDCGKFMIVTEFNENHDHPLMNVNIKTEHIEMEGGELNFVTLKELSSTESDFTEMVETLKENHKCDVNILCDEDDNILCLCFQDPQMKATFHAYPEMIFVEGTYCLNKNGPCIYTILGEDSEGNGVVFSVGVLLNENEEVLDWFINEFKEYNANYREVKVVVTDRDAPINSVLVKNFPEASLEIALFNTLNKFKNEISKDLITNEDEVKRVVELFKEIVLSKSEEVFEEACEKFLSTAPENIMEYYEKTWHPIKDLWVLYLTSNYRFSINDNQNRLEELNDNLKSIILNFTTFEDFIQQFIEYIKQLRTDCYSAHEKKITGKTSVELNQYKINLTNYAFLKTQNQYVQMKNLTSFKAIKEKMLMSDSEGSFEVTMNSCSCLFRITLNLPCSHICKFRKIRKLPTYSEDLFATRWTRKYFQSNFYSISYEDKQNAMSECSNEDDFEFVMMDGGNDDKFKLMYDECVKLSDICTDLPDALFKKRVEFLNNLIKKWANFDDDEEDHEIFQDDGGDASPREFLLEVAEDEEEDLIDDDDEEEEDDSDSDYEVNRSAKRKKIG